MAHVDRTGQTREREEHKRPESSPETQLRSPSKCGVLRRILNWKVKATYSSRLTPISGSPTRYLCYILSAQTTIRTGSSDLNATSASKCTDIVYGCALIASSDPRVQEAHGRKGITENTLTDGREAVFNQRRLSPDERHGLSGVARILTGGAPLFSEGLSARSDFKDATMNA